MAYQVPAPSVPWGMNANVSGMLRNFGGVNVDGSDPLGRFNTQLQLINGQSVGQTNGSPGTASREGNAPLIYNLTQICLPGDPTAAIYPGELIFATRPPPVASDNQYTFPSLVPYGKDPTHVLSVTQLNRVMDICRDIEGFQNPLFLIQQWPVAGIVKSINGLGVNTTAAHQPMSVIAGGEDKIFDYTKAIPGSQVATGTWLMFELRQFSGDRSEISLDEWAAETTTLRGDMGPVGLSPTMMTTADAPTAADKLLSSTSSLSYSPAPAAAAAGAAPVPDVKVPAAAAAASEDLGLFTDSTGSYDVFPAAITVPVSREYYFTQLMAESKEKLTTRKYDNETYWQWVPVLRADKSTDITSDEISAQFYGDKVQKVAYRRRIGLITGTEHTELEHRPSIVFPDPQNVKPTHFGGIGRLRIGVSLSTE